MMLKGLLLPSDDTMKTKSTLFIVEREKAPNIYFRFNFA